ncbi:PH domain-containing protein [Mycobacterium sp. SM1]|uniref:PH domain-containing protein n=1 Tax=Mycobacterium sp. SM1 TaxID=2816243 RepID=UPI001BCD6184|nr:PH domain-containing protein [Mycobacterium sp. SM1]MBS4728102.1 PH domain-containing protein [Mycobacterium sp. SM1]
MQQTQWAPRKTEVAGCGAAGAVLAIMSVILVTDPPGRLLTAVAAVGLILFAGASGRARPKLAITPEGLLARSWSRARVVQRTEIKVIRITEFHRIGRKVRLLEIETSDGRLLIFSRWDLGTDPLNVLDALTAAGYAGDGRR